MGHSIAVPIDDGVYKALAAVIAQARSADFSKPADILVEVRDGSGRVLWSDKKLG